MGWLIQRYTRVGRYAYAIGGAEEPDTGRGGDDEGLLHKVSALGLFQWYLAHRYRAGQASSRLIPYLGVGVIMEGRIF